MTEPLALFPLNVVLVPGLVLPLHIFEPRYRALVHDLMGREDQQAREFGIVAVRQGRSFDDEGPDALYPVGTATVLREANPLPDGRFDIVTTGTRRFRLVDVDRSAPLAVAEVEFLDDVAGPEDELLALPARRAFDAYRRLLQGRLVIGTPDAGEQPELPQDPTVLSYLMTAAMVLPWDERQELLAATDTASRLRAATRLLLRENAVIAALAAVPAVDSLGDPGSVN